MTTSTRNVGRNASGNGCGCERELDMLTSMSGLGSSDNVGNVSRTFYLVFEWRTTESLYPMSSGKRFLADRSRLLGCCHAPNMLPCGIYNVRAISEKAMER